MGKIETLTIIELENNICSKLLASLPYLENLVEGYLDRFLSYFH